MVMGPINPIMYSAGRPVLIGGQPVHYNMQGQMSAIGSQPIHRDIMGQSHLLGGGPVHHGMNTETSEEAGGLPIMRDTNGRPSAVVGPRIGPYPLPPSPTSPAESGRHGSPSAPAEPTTRSTSTPAPNAPARPRTPAVHSWLVMRALVEERKR